MKVYVVVSDYCTETSGVEYNLNGVYTNSDLAVKAMKRIIEEEKAIQSIEPIEEELREFDSFLRFTDENWISVIIHEEELIESKLKDLRALFIAASNEMAAHSCEFEEAHLIGEVEEFNENLSMITFGDYDQKCLIYFKPTKELSLVGLESLDKFVEDTFHKNLNEINLGDCESELITFLRSGSEARIIDISELSDEDAVKQIISIYDEVA